MTLLSHKLLHVMRKRAVGLVAHSLALQCADRWLQHMGQGSRGLLIWWY